MLMQASRREPPAAYVVVLGNEKGGAGKSTVAMHMAVALLNSGQKVATVDLDLRQKTLTHYIENRRAWAKHSGASLAVPSHFCVTRGSAQSARDNEAIEFRDLWMHSARSSTATISSSLIPLAPIIT